MLDSRVFNPNRAISLMEYGSITGSKVGSLTSLFDFCFLYYQ